MYKCVKSAGSAYIPYLQSMPLHCTIRLSIHKPQKVLAAWVNAEILQVLPKAGQLPLREQ